MRIGFLGSSLLSSYWNGAATYYRGIISGLARLGFETTFYEPDAFDRQQHRDLDPPDWARSVVYPAIIDAAMDACQAAMQCEVVVKASGIGVFDDEIVAAVTNVSTSASLRIFWDVDAPATLSAMEADDSHPLRRRLSRFDGVLTYGGGRGVVDRYKALGAKRCVPIYNALDPTTHFPVPPDIRFRCDLAFLGNRLPDREARVANFFFGAATRLPDRQFILAGNGWETSQLPPNVRSIGHLPTKDHNAFNATPLAVINIARDSMAEAGFSPATRVFEAAGAGACIISDAWKGMEQFLEPHTEVLLANSGAHVAEILSRLTQERAADVGRRARHRILREHTYELRARQVAHLLRSWSSDKHARVQS